jgi:hypothetical protein
MTAMLGAAAHHGVEHADGSWTSLEHELYIPRARASAPRSIAESSGGRRFPDLDGAISAQFDSPLAGVAL